ncbi:MAG: bifunctional diaminohydroxyphosphoribosylaminopyrimidine deaminase/5-amino-6-(5-phosphoribosylamino)uracil reductase RibD [bacterium]
MHTDEDYMHLALDMAEKGAGFTSPNPMVGAVVVKDTTIVGKDYHTNVGRLHAEVKALQEAGDQAQGATLYVNLEPCCHYGKTPPCVEAIINAGIAKVVIGTQDPNPLVNGRGIAELRSHGIEVKVGVLEDKAKKINEFFIKYITTGKPFVILKAAMSLDGKIATKTGQSQWISNEASRQFVHALRNRVDAIMVGAGTILQDNPLLTTRISGQQSRNPKRIIIDNLLKIPLGARIFTQEAKGEGSENIIVTTCKASQEKIKRFEEQGSRIIQIHTKRKNSVDFGIVLDQLGKLSLTSIMIEGGHGINAAALEACVVDKVIIFIAPKIIGGKTAPGIVSGEGIAYLKDAVCVHDMEIRRFENDFMIEGYIG